MRAEVSDLVLSVIEPLLPLVRGGSAVVGSPLAVEGMGWKYRTGSLWRDAPAEFGRWDSIDKQFIG